MDKTVFLKFAGCVFGTDVAVAETDPAVIETDPAVLDTDIGVLDEELGDLTGIVGLTLSPRTRLASFMRPRLLFGEIFTTITS